MIRTFKCKETQRVFNNQFSRKLPHDIQRIAQRKLKMIHAAAELSFLTVPPANRLEALDGDRQGQHSIRINDQWRICFKWSGSDAYEVEITDYH